MTPSVNQSDQSATHSRVSICRHLSALLLVAIFIADILTPLGLAHGVLYVLVIALASMTGSHRWVIRLGLWSLLLCSIGMLLGEIPEGVLLANVIINRLLSLIAIGITLAFSVRWLKTRTLLHQQSNRAEKKQAELLRWQTILDTLSHQAHIGYWWYDKQTHRFHWSELTHQLLGLMPSDPPSMLGTLKPFPEPGRQQLLQAFERCIEHGHPYTEKLPMILPNGRHCLVETSGRPVFNQHGEQTGAAGTLHTLSETQQSNRHSAEDATTLRQQLDTLPLTVWSAQPNGTIDYFNQTLSDFSGVPRDTLSAPGEWLTLLHPDDQERCTLTWTRCVRAGLPYNIQFRIRRYDGEYRWHQVQATPVRGLDGTITRWYGSVVEIPETTVTV